MVVLTYCSIGHALGYQDYTDGETGDDVASQPANIYGVESASRK